MILALTSIVAGLVGLYLGAHALVRGAASLARRLGLSPLVIGLTVVAFGTSTPELFVVLSASLEGREAISVGNVLGANALNIGLILGATAVIAPLKVQSQLIRFDVPIMIVASMVLAAFLADSALSRIEGAALFSGILAYIGFSVVMARRERSATVLEEFAEAVPRRQRSVNVDMGYLVAGLVLLAGASQFLVNGAVTIARMFGVSDAVIGITVVAAGTTLPELITCVVAALRKEGDIAVGNVVGSNIFNILCVLGLAAMIRPLTAPGISMTEVLGAVALAAFSLAVMWRGFVVNRFEGGALVLAYAAYIYLVWTPRV